jgi:hypothetical protein
MFSVIIGREVNGKGFLLISTDTCPSRKPRTFRSLGRIQHLIPPHDAHLGIQLDTIRLAGLALLGPLGNTLVIAARIDAEDAADVVAVTGHGELAEGVAPLVEKAADGFADLVFTVLGVVARASDGIDRARRGAMFQEDAFKV